MIKFNPITGNFDLVEDLSGYVPYTGATAEVVLGQNLTLQDDKYLYFDTAKNYSLKYSSAHSGFLWNSSSGEFLAVADLKLIANTAADASGNWEPYICLDTNGTVQISNTNQGAAGNKYLVVDMTDGLKLRTGGAKDAFLLADNVATANKTFQFPNISGTLVTTAGAGAAVNLGAYSFKVGDATNYAETKNDGEINLHGTARVERHLRVGAGSWNHGASAPSAGFEGVFSTLDFDAASDDEAHYTLIIPSRWDSTIDIEFVVDWFYEGAQDNGTVCWGLEYKGVKAGEAVTGAGTTITKVSAGTHTTGQMVRTTFTTKILAANLEEHDTLGLRLYRDVSADTLAVDARIINTHFHFTQNKLGKAT